MEITLKLEPIGNYSTGGGYREVSAVITVDSTDCRRMQRESVLFETLGAMLDYVFTEEQIHEIALRLNDALDQWEGEHERTRGNEP